VILKQKNGVLFFQFPNLASFSDDIWHGIFTRNCGCSHRPFRSLNISYGVGDSMSNVRRNRNIISECIEEKDLVFVHQIHATDVLVYERNDNPKSTSESSGETSGRKDVVAPSSNSSRGRRHQLQKRNASDRQRVGDAMVTDIPKKFLAVQAADCQSILMYDPARRVVANVHSGWRGSTKNIISRTLQVMEDRFDCRPRDIIAGIGPSLGPCCAEFVNYQTEIPPEFWRYKDNSNHFDFWAISRDQLCDAGVLIQNIDSSRLCTRCNTDLFFSFRKEGITGRIASVIGLK
jgi:YfiH family protein